MTLIQTLRELVRTLSRRVDHRVPHLHAPSWQGTIMQHPTATLHCPNPACQTLNPEENRFCLKCGTFLPRHYLWSLGSCLVDRYPLGELLGDRYVLKTEQIVIDIYPTLPPETPEEVPPEITAYLRLFAHRLHVPQVYGCLSLPSLDKSPSDIWLLENAPIQVDGNGVRLYPSLFDAWSPASPMRQLNWLWQSANLWSPFLKVGVASSLLNPKLLRVEGSTLRLLELTHDTTKLTFKQLGQFWSEWIEVTALPMRDFLHRLCQLLIEGQVKSAEQLVSLLDRGLAVVGRQQSRQIDLVTLSDKGPSRTRNEDACYPPSGTKSTVTSEALAIVCDGVGGHEGGDVASGIAIKTISQHLQPVLKTRDSVSPSSLSSALENSIYDANTAISVQNNNEQRQGRQRMGTTVAIGLTHGHEFYITHVGDSRVYRITSQGCHQLTLDDDVASREVRLGYSLYRNALQQVAAGSLVQAIGMGASNTLYPNINRLIVDEDCLFLLCSDGLSDYDRVEQSWEEELLPVLQGKLTLAEAACKLVSIANKLNGHDNVTVALVRLQVRSSNAQSITPSLLVDQLDSIPNSSSHLQNRSSMASADIEETENLPTRVVLKAPTSRSRSIVPALISMLVVGLALAGASVWAYFSLPTVRSWVDGRLDGEIATSPGSATDPPSTAVLALEDGTPIQLQAGTQLWKVLGEPTKGFQEVPAETVLQVINRQAVEEVLWLALQVCSVPEIQASPTPKETSSQKTASQTAAEGKGKELTSTPTPLTPSNADSDQETRASSPSISLSASPVDKGDGVQSPSTDQGHNPNDRPSVAPSSPGKKGSEGVSTPPATTLWIVAAELDRVGFEKLDADKAESNTCTEVTLSPDTASPNPTAQTNTTSPEPTSSETRDIDQEQK